MVLRYDHVRKIQHLYSEAFSWTISKWFSGEHVDDYATFFTVKETPKQGRKVIWNQGAIRSHRDNFTGYWALVTNTESDAGRALTHYRKRDHVEKQFDTLKNLLEGNRLRTKTAVSAEAVVFLRFLSLIITERIRKILRKTPIDSKVEHSKKWISLYTVPDVFNQLESYTEERFKQKYKPILPAKTKAQREIFHIFDLEWFWTNYKLFEISGNMSEQKFYYVYRKDFEYYIVNTDTPYWDSEKRVSYSEPNELDQYSRWIQWTTREIGI